VINRRSFLKVLGLTVLSPLAFSLPPPVKMVSGGIVSGVDHTILEGSETVISTWSTPSGDALLRDIRYLKESVRKDTGVLPNIIRFNPHIMPFNPQLEKYLMEEGINIASNEGIDVSLDFLD